MKKQTPIIFIHTKKVFKKIFSFLCIKPNKYSKIIKAQYLKTLYFEGYTTTANKLFSNDKVALAPLVFHFFNYDYNGTKYEFKMKNNKGGEFNTTDEYKIWINPDKPSNFWFENIELKAYLWMPDEEYDDFE